VPRQSRYRPGHKKGRLTLVRFFYEKTTGGNRKRVARVKCDCGAEFDKQAASFIHTKNPELQMCDSCRANTPTKQVAQAHYESQDKSTSVHLTAKDVSDDVLKAFIEQLGPQVEQFLEKHRT
jgi:hypothetical protein